MLMDIFEKIYDIIVEFSGKIASALPGFEALAMVAGAVLAVLLLIIILCVGAGSYAGKLSRALKKSNKMLSRVESVNEDNADDFTEKCFKKMPSSVRFGWNCFMNNTYGYPSEFITEYDCVRVPNVKYGKRNAISAYIFIMAIVTGLSYIVIKAAGLTSKISGLVFGLPVFFTILGAFILNFAYNNREIKLFSRFLDFQMLLDKKVILKSQAFGTAESTDGADFAQAPVVETETEEKPEVIEATPVVSEIKNPVVTEDDERMRMFVGKIDAICASDASASTLENILAKINVRLQRSSLPENDRTQLLSCADKLSKAIKRRK